MNHNLFKAEFYRDLRYFGDCLLLGNRLIEIVNHCLSIGTVVLKESPIRTDSCFSVVESSNVVLNLYNSTIYWEYNRSEIK